MKKITLIFLFSVSFVFAQTVTLTDGTFDNDNAALPTTSPGDGLGWYVSSPNNVQFVGGECKNKGKLFSFLKQDLVFPTAGIYLVSVDVRADGTLLKNLYFTLRDKGDNTMQEIWVLSSGSANVSVPESTNNPGFGKNMQPKKADVSSTLTTFTAKVQINTDNESYLLQLSNNVDTTEAGQFIFYDNVTVTYDSGLTTESFAIEDLKLSSNPVNQFLTVSGTYNVRDIVIYDVLGHQLYQSNWNAPSFKLNVSHFSKGTYLLKLSDSNASKILRFVKN